MDELENSNHFVGVGCWMLIAGYWLLDILGGHQIIGFVAVCFLDDVLPVGKVVKGGLGMGVYVCIPCRGVGWLDLFD